MNRDDRDRYLKEYADFDTLYYAGGDPQRGINSPLQYSMAPRVKALIWGFQNITLGVFNLVFTDFCLVVLSSKLPV